MHIEKLSWRAPELCDNLIIPYSSTTTIIVGAYTPSSMYRGRGPCRALFVYTHWRHLSESHNQLEQSERKRTLITSNLKRQPGWKYMNMLLVSCHWYWYVFRRLDNCEKPWGPWDWYTLGGMSIRTIKKQTVTTWSKKTHIDPPAVDSNVSIRWMEASSYHDRESEESTSRVGTYYLCCSSFSRLRVTTKLMIALPLRTSASCTVCSACQW